ncbi:aromatic acid exporter family protein [uncultured Anaerococcus sp.]|uniref:FUSC family protein n=1 Tax=uncultured Anaerococcus sp. TaxID=293428 RepID=UPI00262C23D6|nr:FUSC family protein [uncultured Anaerococcus sp.]
MLKKPGLRIIKTGLAVIISLIISELRPGSSLGFYAAIAAVICMQPNVNQTLSKGINRVIGTIFGGFIGLIYLVVIPEGSIPLMVDYILISLVATLIIWIMASLNRKDAVSIAAIVFLSITINHANDPAGLPLPFALNRTLDTLIGVLVAIFVNYIDFKLRKSLKPNK